MLGQTHVYYIYYGNWSVDPLAAGILSTFSSQHSSVRFRILQYPDAILFGQR